MSYKGPNWGWDGPGYVKKKKKKKTKQDKGRWVQKDNWEGWDQTMAPSRPCLDFGFHSEWEDESLESSKQDWCDLTDFFS